MTLVRLMMAYSLKAIRATILSQEKMRTLLMEAIGMTVMMCAAPTHMLHDCTVLTDLTCQPRAIP